eukprot:g777.t1
MDRMAPREAQCTAAARPELVFDAVCLLGFNEPRDLAPVRVQHWDTTCADVVHRLLRLAWQEEVEEAEHSQGNLSHASGRTSTGGSPVAVAPERGAFGRRQHFIFHPTVGPEPISGSTRMKGGSATKILLEAVILAALAEHLRGRQAKPSSVPSSVEESESESESAQERMQRHATTVVAALHSYAAVMAAIYAAPAAEALADIVRRAGTSLCNHGSVVYAGASSAGILGLFDSAECPPTFGAHWQQIRGFLRGGWFALGDAARGRSEAKSLARNERQALDEGVYTCKVQGKGMGGEDARVHDLSISLGALLSRGFTRSDTVLLLVPSNCAAAEDQLDAVAGGDMWKSLEAVAKAACNSGAHCQVVAFSDASVEAHTASEFAARLATLERAAGSKARLCVSLHRTTLDVTDHAQEFGVYAPPVLSEFALKLCLNAISTGAFIQKGHVLQNRMINLSISNVKLWQRSIAIVRHFSGAGERTALECVVRSAYRIDTVPSELLHADDESHVAQAKPLPKVVPLALLLAAHIEAQRRSGRKRKHDGVDSLTVRRALEALDATPIIRSLLKHLLHSNQAEQTEK